MGKKDLFYDLLANPQLSLGDLEAVGHSTENSRLFSKDFYKNNEKVRNEFTKDDGTFDDKAFDQAYSVASYYWNGMTNGDYNKNLIQYTSFDKNNIFADPKLRTLNDSPKLIKAPNVTGDTWGISEMGKSASGGKSVEEIAQAEKILLNPTEVEQGADPIWGESPNEEWWTKPFSTRVLAKYDSAGFHKDAITGENVWHEKDELKINSNGTYFYEDLDGRDIYGRQVLNKYNTLTTDGSWWNQYDFLDQDDLNQKSIAGSLTKNLALVGSMFIPYVGWGIAAASVLQQATGLVGTFGKVLTGSDNSTLSAMEGFSKSWNRSGAKTQYAQQNLLCCENVIDLIGDTAAQLREQRAIFKFVPAIFKGKYGALGKKGQEAFVENRTKEMLDEFNTKGWKEVATNLAKQGKSRAEIEMFFNSETPGRLMRQSAASELEKYLTSYNEIGEKIARAYMVGITVGDAYGEAKAAGATDGEAALLTIGYAAAENALLSTDLGKWIFPELKGEKLKYKSMAKAFAGLSDTTRKLSGNLRKAKNEEIRTWAKRLFNAGKEAAKQDYSLLNKTTGSILASGLGEGVEEVSEELLADFSKACFNVYRDMTGQDKIMDTFNHNWNWEEAGKRYGMSFAGGLVGGGINAAGTDFSQIRSFANMTSSQAMQELTWMARHNQLGEFWETVNKMELGNSKLGTKRAEDGSWEVGTDKDNQDLEVKKLLKNTILKVQDIVRAEGAALDDNSFIGTLINSVPQLRNYDLLGELRTDAIAKSTAAGKLVKNYNNLISKIVSKQEEIDAIIENLPDADRHKSIESLPDEVKNRINPLMQDLEKLREQKDAIVNGDFTNDLVRHSLFEATYGLAEGFTTATEVQYIKKQLEAEGKSIETLSDDEKEEWHKKYIEYAKSEKADDIEFFADLYQDIARVTSNGLINSMDFYQKLRDQQLPKLEALQKLSLSSLSSVLQRIEAGSDATEIQDYLSTLTLNQTGKYSRPVELAESMQVLNENPSNPENIQKFQELHQQLQNANSLEEITRIQQEMQEIQDSDPEIKAFVSNLRQTSKVQNTLGSVESLLRTIDDIYNNPELQMPSVRATAIANAVMDTFSGDLFEAIEEVKESGFVHPEVRVLLKNSLEDLGLAVNQYMHPEFLKSLDSIFGIDFDDKVIEIQDKAKEYSELLDTLPNTPIQEMLNSFTISLKTNNTVKTLINEAINKQELHKQDMENMALEEPEIFDYEQALKILELCRQGIIGARVDGVDLENLYGYNKTLNELTKKDPGYVELAEIDAIDANYALQDIELAIRRLKAMQGLHEINTGNKLNAQNHAAVNKSLIMYNRVRRLITSMRDDDDSTWDYGDLEKVVEQMQIHKDAWGDEEKKPEINVSQRKLGLTTEERINLETEAITLENALYDFFQKNMANVKNKEKLAKLLSNFNYFDKNNGILNKESQDIDDNAFTWWLASKAALKSSDFNSVFIQTIDGEEVEKPIAPIPTQELGVYMGIAAIYNGDMFKYFANAISEVVYQKWKNSTPKERLDIFKKNNLITFNSDGKEQFSLALAYEGEDAPSTYQKDPSYNSIYDSDFIPKYVGMLFIEGIAGSGKSTGVFKSIMKILFNQDPEITENHHLSEYPIFFVHGTKKNAQDVIDSFEADKQDTKWSFEAHDQKSLFDYFTPDFREPEKADNGELKYIEGEDVVLENGVYRSNWRIRNFSNPDKQIPKIIFIDEWSQYTQPQIDFLQRLSDTFGIQFITGGDLQQNTPRAAIYTKSENGKPETRVADVTIDRNVFSRTQKLGVSMRTGNGVKTENQNRARNWEEHPDLPIELLHVEVDNQLYGDKVYNADRELTKDQLEGIALDIQKMVASLDSNEKIGYIYSSEDSSVYKLIKSQFADHFDFYKDIDAQGREARYYIVENDRTLGHYVKGANGKDQWVSSNPVDYYRAFHTGLTRAEQATIIIAPQSKLGNSQMGVIEVKNAKIQPDKLTPDGYSLAGLKKYSRTRKEQSTKSLEKLKEKGIIPKDADLSKVTLTYVKRSTEQSVPIPDTATPSAAEALTVASIPENAPTTALSVIHNMNFSSNTNDDSTESESSKEINTEDSTEDNTEATEEVEQLPSGEPEETIPETPTPITETSETSESSSDQLKTEGESEDQSQKLILPRGTELIDNRPGQNMSWAGNILKYNEEDSSYSVTTDTETGKETYRIPYDEVHGTYTLEDSEPVMQFITNSPDNPIYFDLLELDKKLAYTGKYPIGTKIYNTATNELEGSIIDFNGGNYILDNGKSIPTKELDIPYAYSIGETSINKYHNGEVIANGPISYTITKATKLASGGYSYETKKNVSGTILSEPVTLSEQDIDNLINIDGYSKSANNIPEVLGIETGNASDYQKDIEEALETTETIEEQVEVEKGNIQFSIFGHTFNTFYTGLDFERAKQENRPPIPIDSEPGFDRIDMGIGLYKIGQEKNNPLLCSSEENVIAILGAIRNGAMYAKDNNALISIIKKVIPDLKNDNLEIKYAWVSKSKERNNPEYARKNDRFTAPTGKLRNMPEGDENQEAKEKIPLKTLSLIVRTKNSKDGEIGRSILEIPMLTFTSPLTILYKIGHKNSEDPVYKYYIKKIQEYKGQPGYKYLAIRATHEFIEKDKGKTLGKGYQAFSDLCKMWLFNNDGIRFIDGTNKNEFVFSQAFPNLGVRFVKQRQVQPEFNDDDNPNNYEGIWHNLAQEVKSRPEVTYSSIMKATNRFYNSGDGKVIEIAAAGHAFVLRWEGTEKVYGELTDQRMMDRYILQLKNPDLPKLVKLEYVSPPEATVTTYLQNLPLKAENPFGNKFTPYRILSAIYAEGKTTALWGHLQNLYTTYGNVKDLENAIKALDDIAKTTQKNSNENHAQWLSRVVEAQNNYINNIPGLIELMNDALFSLAYPKILGADGYYESNGNQIAAICEKAGITGILRKTPLQEGDPISGYAYLVQTSATDKYKSPEGDSWRIYSKFDSPTFDVSWLLNQKEKRGDNVFSRWASYAKFNKKAGVWYFGGGYPELQKNYYFAGGANEDTHSEPPIIQWRKNIEDLLGKIGLKDDNQVGNNATSEAEFLQEVANYWVSQTDSNGVGVGNMAMVFGNTIFCGNMDDDHSTQNLPEYYKHLQQIKSPIKDEANPNMYMLTMRDNRTNTEYQVNVEISPENKTYNISYVPQAANIQKSAVEAQTLIRQTVEQLNEHKQVVQNWLNSKGDSPATNLVKTSEIIQQVLDNFLHGDPILPTEFELATALVEAFNSNGVDLRTAGLAFKKNAKYFRDLNSLMQESENTNSDEQQKEEQYEDVCPIFIGAKSFM